MRFVQKLKTRHDVCLGGRDDPQKKKNKNHSAAIWP